MSIKISQIKDFREQLGMTHIVVFTVDKEGNQHVATHGETQQQAREAAEAGNKLKSVLGWPDNLCHSSPLARIHNNCTYYKPDYGIWCVNGWSQDGTSGYCCVEPRKILVIGEERACVLFEPNY